MAERVKFDVFLSYRREGGFEIANLIHDRLSRQGYRVFMDCEDLRSGKFDEQLYGVIDEVKDVVVILSTGSLERCAEEGDWLRLEIARAIAKGKNVVPVRLREFEFPQNLPPDIRELKVFQGVEASQELFRAFVERLKELLHARKRWTLARLWRPLVATLVPILCALSVLGYFHLRQKTRYEQVCKEIVGIMGLEFIKMNGHLDVMEQAEKVWVAFADGVDGAPTQNHQRLAQNVLEQLAQLKGSMEAPILAWPLTPEAERLLAENRQPTEDIKIFFTTDHRAEAFDFLGHLERWAKTPRQGWPAHTREVVKLEGETYRELIIGNYYAFLELLAGMPQSARGLFLEAKPRLTRFPIGDANWGVAELKALQERSLQRAEELEHQSALLVGGDAVVMERVEKQLKVLAKRVASGDQDARRYAAAASRYYSAVLAKGLPPQGILVAGTQNDQPHPLYQVGDVVLERKGKTIRSADDYFALRDDPAPNVVRLVRFDDKGEPRFLTETVPASKVLVGFVDLWER